MRAFLRALDAHGVETWLRFVLMTDRSERFVEYATNGEDDLRALAELSKAHARACEGLNYCRIIDSGSTNSNAWGSRTNSRE